MSPKALLITSRHCRCVCGHCLLHPLPTSLNRNPMTGSATFLRPSSRKHPCWCRNIRLLPIDYAFRPRLRSRLTLGGLALPRNPWTYGESVSHTLCRYSCQHSHFRYLQHPSQDTFTGLRNAPLPLLRREVRSFGAWLEPRYIFGAGRLN